MITSGERSRLIALASRRSAECSSILRSLDDEEVPRGSAASRLAKERRAKRECAAGMLNAEALGILMAVYMIEHPEAKII